MPPITPISFKNETIREFVELYGSDPGILHIEYGKHIPDNIIVFFDSKTLQDALPYTFACMNINMFDVRQIREDAAEVFPKTVKEESIHKMLKCVLILCDDLINGYRKKEHELGKHKTALTLVN